MQENDSFRLISNPQDALLAFFIVFLIAILFPEVLR
jgi:hypothetical protein